MNVEIIMALALAGISVWLGGLCLLVGIRKFRKKSLKGDLWHEFVLHQAAFVLTACFCLVLINDEYGMVAWVGVMLSSWYLIYALWAMDSSDFKRPRLRKIFAVPLFCLALCSALWVFGFRVNATVSLPQGLYRQESSSDSLAYGDLVSFCLPPDNAYSDLAAKRGYLSSGPCSNGLQPLLKAALGFPGDRLDIGPEGIAVNNILLPGTIRPEVDSREREMPPSLLESGVIPPGYVLTLAVDQPGSFDSRHYGLIPLARIKKIKPVFTN